MGVSSLSCSLSLLHRQWLNFVALMSPFRNHKRSELYAEQDRIEPQRDGLIEQIERQLVMTHAMEVLFTVQWVLT